jgi:sigma-B regulation protein RsbU (phosphoserine phosphatase)
MITQSFQEFLRQYLEKRLGSTQDPGFRGLRVLARATHSDHWFVPPDPTLDGLDHLLSRVVSLQQECTGRVSLAGEAGFALAIPGKYLENTTLLAIFTEREMDQLVGRWRMAVLIGMLLAFVIALVTGFVLSENILNPIAGLARGIAALEARDRQFRLPTGRRDEFGDLALSFNRVIEDLKEMELAQTFQESLLPDRLPAVPGFDLDRLHLRAGRSFGDFLDVQPRPDGSVLLVLGDGTGSGIASGLLMAMVKALVFESAQEGGSLPDLMADLNRLMCDHLRRKELFSFLGAVLEPTSGRLSFCNAGMPFPIRVSGNGQMEDLRLVGFPLGFREEQAPFVPRELALAPGDGVVFFTNGLLKLPPSEGGPDGYADLRGRLGERPLPAAADLCRAVGESITRTVPAEGPPDDVAILFVKRLPG